MNITERLNNFTRRIGTYLLLIFSPFNAFLISILAFGSLIGLAVNLDRRFETTILLIIFFLYLFLTINSILYALNALFVRRGFYSEVENLKKRGIPLKGVVGFPETLSEINSYFATSVGVSVTVLISFVLFIVILKPVDGGLELDTGLVGQSFLLLGTGLLIVGAATTLISRPPQKPAFVPGGLMGFYEPKSLPLILDNLFADSLYPFLDPPTKLKFDDWSNEIMANLNPKFNPNLPKETRMEMVREKIFMMLYLSEQLPTVFSEEVIANELSEVVNGTFKEDFLSKGGSVGISKKILNDIIEKTTEQIPEIYIAFERLLVNLTDNLIQFKRKSLFVSTVYPNKHSGTIKPFRILVFVVNKDSNYRSDKRVVKFKVETGFTSIDPESFEYELYLDTYTKEAEIKADKLPFLSTDKNDAITAASELLQIGDALWLQFKPNRLGTHVINVSIEEPGKGVISGETIYIDVKRDLNYLLKTYGSKIGTYAGAAISAIGLSFGSLLSVFGN